MTKCLLITPTLRKLIQNPKEFRKIKNCSTVRCREIRVLKKKLALMKTQICFLIDHDYFRIGNKELDELSEMLLVEISNRKSPYHAIIKSKTKSSKNVDMTDYENEIYARNENVIRYYWHRKKEGENIPKKIPYLIPPEKYKLSCKLKTNKPEDCCRLISISLEDAIKRAQKIHPKFNPAIKRKEILELQAKRQFTSSVQVSP